MRRDEHFKPEVRRTGVYASEAPEALGVSPYSGRSPLRLYREKLGLEPPLDISARANVIAGHDLQPVIGPKFERLSGLKARPQDDAAVSGRYPWLRAHTDFIVGDGKALLEVKAYHAAKRKDYGERGSADVPMHDLIQCLHESVAFNVPVVYLGVLFGGVEFEYFEVPTPPQLQEEYVERIAGFWAALKTQTPPAPANAADILRLYPHDNGLSVVADRELAAIYGELTQHRAKMDLHESRAKELAEAIKLRMGAASTLVAADGRTLVTWRAAKDSRSFDAKAFAAAHPDLYEKFLRTVPGSRRFLPK